MPAASMKKIDTEFMIFDRLMYIDPWNEIVKVEIREISSDLWFWWWITPSIKFNSQCSKYKYMVEFTSWFLDLQWTYVQTLSDSDQSKKNSKIFGYIEFVTTPVTFNLKISKNHDFDDLGKAVTNIVNLMCSNGPGGCVGAQGCVEHGLEFSRSNLRSKTV